MKTLIFVSLFLYGSFVLGAKLLSPNIQKALKEAENLSLSHERLLACNVLSRNLKKIAGQEEVAVLKDKLHALSRVFYTDKGLQDYLVGKELFEKQKYNDSAEKLQESDDEEKGNVEVLHLLSLAYLQAQKPGFAEAASRRAAQIVINDIEIGRDLLSVLVTEEKWEEALETSDHLIKEEYDLSAMTLYERGLAQLKLGFSEEAQKTLDAVLQKDPQLSEAYFWLGSLKPKPEASTLLGKYLQSCKKKARPHLDRDPNLCINIAEAEKKLKL